MEAGKKMTPGGQEGREELKPEPGKRENAAQGSGIRSGGCGFDRCGQELRDCTNAAPVEGPVVTTTCPRSKRLVGGAVSGLVSNNPALRNELRSHDDRRDHAGTNASSRALRQP